MSFLKKIVIIVLLLTPLISLEHAKAQDYNLVLPKVTQNGTIREVDKIGEEFVFKDILTLNDNLRFGWSNIELDLESKSTKTPNKGYIKAYINEVKDENFILDFASSPLRIDSLAQKLKEGLNKVVFVLIVNGIPSGNKIIFSFNFKATSNDPLLKISKPNNKVVFWENMKHDFVINVENIIIKSGLNLSNHGKINVYLNTPIEENYLTQIIESEQVGNASILKFNSDIFGEKFKKTPDSLSNKLIFVPISNTNKFYNNSQTTLDIITNFQNTLDVKQPTLDFVNVNDSNNSIKKDEIIKFKINNFKVLKFDTRNSVSTGEGYLQVLINDKPHKITFDKTEFTLNEIIPNYKLEKVNLKLQLVNSDFTPLNPVVSNSIDLFLKNETPQNITERIQASNWRLIVIGITILLILGSVLYILFKT
jgi:hypothetical protein